MVEKSQVGGSLKRQKDDDGESLYRKRGGVVVAAGNNDLDRHFTGIVKERGLIEFLPGTFVFVLSIVDVLSLAAAAPLSISLCRH